MLAYVTLLLKYLILLQENLFPLATANRICAKFNQDSLIGVTVRIEKGSVYYSVERHMWEPNNKWTEKVFYAV
jgi:hypothetical protein